MNTIRKDKIQENGKIKRIKTICKSIYRSDCGIFPVDGTGILHSHILDSGTCGELAGGHGVGGRRQVYAFYRHSAIVDNHTDMLMYQGTIPNKPEYNVVQRAMSVNQYPRYWHGYMVSAAAADSDLSGTGAPISGNDRILSFVFLERMAYRTEDKL